jgi:quinol monooxygenase YgiN
VSSASPPTFAVTVRVAVAPGCDARFLDRVRRQADETRAAEPGCHRFDVCVPLHARGEVLLYELYADERSFAAHLETPHFKAFECETADWVVMKRVELWRRATSSS